MRKIMHLYPAKWYKFARAPWRLPALVLSSSLGYAMPPRRDLKKILIIGSGPITIGQAAEFDYSGTQAVKALRGAGYEVVLVNSNPATIMTDPELAERTYIEPLTLEFLERILAEERPDALLPTWGGRPPSTSPWPFTRKGSWSAMGWSSSGPRPRP